MKLRALVLLTFCFLCHSLFAQKNEASKIISYYPISNSQNINPDIRLQLTFPSEPIIGTSGKIRVYDASNNELVDMLDLSIPPGPKNNRAPAPYDALVYKSIPNTLYTVYKPDTTSPHIYQKKYIGGKTEADVYHFYPILINKNTATIHLHSNKLNYNKTYYVLIDSGAIFLKDDSFSGISNKTDWVFSTKKTAPSLKLDTYTVSTDSSGDFNTVQAAIDFIPSNNPTRKTIFIKNGTYNEIVYFRNKENVTFLGENKSNTIISYANNGVFNNYEMTPDPALAGGYHNIRAVFAVNKSIGIHFINLTLRSLGEKPAQAEALLIKGKKNIVSHVNIEGSGDALQASGTIYLSHSKIQGFGDNVLGYGALFFDSCDFVSTYGPHLWVRNTQKNHGNVLVNCTLRTIGDVETTVARAPDNHGTTYPYVEAVLIDCKLEGIRPEGWGRVTAKSDSIRYWEYNSTNLIDGQPVDFSKRHPVAKKLTMEKDAEIISNYKNPSYVLGGWMPTMKPQIISQPISVSVKKGASTQFNVQITAIAEVNYMWFKNGKKINGATSPTLKIDDVKYKNRGVYFVTVTNQSGKTSSKQVTLTVK